MYVYIYPYIHQQLQSAALARLLLEARKDEVETAGNEPAPVRVLSKDSPYMLVSWYMCNIKSQKRILLSMCALDVAVHCVRLAAACLAVCEDGSVEAVEERVRRIPAHVFKNIGLRSVVRRYVVEAEAQRRVLTAATQRAR